MLARYTLCLLMALTLTACGGGPDLTPLPAGADAIAVGDSILDWNRDEDADIPAVVGRELGLTMGNRSVSGALMVDSGPVGIPQQYVSGSWKLVILEGGANDIGDGDCADPSPVIAEGATSGRMVELLDTVLADIPELVALVGYYDVPEGAEFAACAAEFDTLRARFAQLADRHGNVIYIDPRQAVTPTANPDAYDPDLIHPPVSGGQLIGTYIAEQVRAAQMP